MNNPAKFTKFIASLFTAAIISGTAAIAWAGDSFETNDAKGEAKGASVGVTVEVILGNAGDATTKDVDFYKFDAVAGQTIDISALGMQGANSVDLQFYLWGPDGTMLRHIDDQTLNTGDQRDPVLTGYSAPETGTYTIGVVQKGRALDTTTGAVVLVVTTKTETTERSCTNSFDANFNVVTTCTGGEEVTTTTSEDPGADAGDYKLTVSVSGGTGGGGGAGEGAGGSEQQIVMNIDSGKSKVRLLDPKKRRNVPVAILGSPSLDVSKINQASLRFGSPTGKGAVAKKCKIKDVNNDGLMDLSCKFSNRKAGFKHGDVEGKVSGVMNDGTVIIGQAPLGVVNRPEKRRDGDARKKKAAKKK